VSVGCAIEKASLRCALATSRRVASNLTNDMALEMRTNVSEGD
jgi:hypothetical protein